MTSVTVAILFRKENNIGISVVQSIFTFLIFALTQVLTGNTIQRPLVLQ